MAAYARDQKWRPRRGMPTGHRGRPSGVASSKAPDLSFVLKDLEQRVATLSLDSTAYTSERIRLHRVKPVASYSWINAPVPTIVVPGSPWIWADERPPVRRVPIDTGVQHIHHDASKMGSQSSLLPLFAAVDAMNDAFPYKDFDLVTDRNGLRKLLRYVDDARAVDNFRIDVDLVGKTCLFIRREEITTIVGEFTGYGHEYRKAATREPVGCEKMLDHHRVISYKFGSLNVLLSFTADACVERKNDDDDLLASFSTLSLETKEEGTTKSNKQVSPAGLDIRFTPSRSIVPQSDLIEVKTRSALRELDWNEIYPQLYLSQTPWLYMARHTKGNFQPVEKVALGSDEMRPHAEMMESSLGKLKNLLKMILKVVHEQGEGVPLSLVGQGGTLALWKRKEGSGGPLGDEIRSKFQSGVPGVAPPAS